MTNTHKVDQVKIKKFSDIKMLRKGASHIEIVDFPGLEGVKVGIKPLTQEQAIFAQTEAKKSAHARFGSDIDQIILANVWNWYNIQKSVRALNSSYEDQGEFFSDWLEVGQLTSEEQMFLTEIIDSVVEKVSPIENVDSPEEFGALLENVKKKSLNLMSLSSSTQKKLLSYLIDLLKVSPLDNGSGYSLSLNEIMRSKKTHKKKLSKKQKIKDLELGATLQ